MLTSQFPPGHSGLPCTSKDNVLGEAMMYHAYVSSITVASLQVRYVQFSSNALLVARPLCYTHATLKYAIPAQSLDE